MTKKISNARVREFTPLPTPSQLAKTMPLSNVQKQLVITSRNQIRACLNGKDDRLLIITGPCSIHDQKAALEYAQFIQECQQEFSSKLLIVMRVYFEKPRTTVGWKGLLNDPFLDGSQNIAYGLEKAREILLAITNLGVPTATEFLDPITPQYIADLVSWAAIGARTTESQTHREMVSGLSMPTGFKNSTDGSFDNAINAMASAKSSHSFLGIDNEGMTSIVKTTGNADVHLVLRGGKSGPNFDSENICKALASLNVENPNRPILVDCSHGNSSKDYTKQPEVFHSVLQQVASGNNQILGMMLESHLTAGKQSFSQGDDNSHLVYGQSITDGCIDTQETRRLFKMAIEKLS